jgi:hypothetical protein
MVGNIYKLKGDDFEAQRCWTEAYKVFKELGLDDPEVAAVMEQLVGVSEVHPQSHQPTADSFYNQKDGMGGAPSLFETLKEKVKAKKKKDKGQKL